MGLGDKIKHTAEKVTGKGKEVAGDVSGNDKLKAEGKTQHAKAEMKQAAEKTKDAITKPFKKH